MIEALQHSSAVGVMLDFEMIMCAVKSHDLRVAHPQTVAAFIELLKGKVCVFNLVSREVSLMLVECS